MYEIALYVQWHTDIIYHMVPLSMTLNDL